jgi:hypothetical protein
VLFSGIKYFVPFYAKKNQSLSLVDDFFNSSLFSISTSAKRYRIA